MPPVPKPHYLVDDQLALEDGQEVPGLLAHCHSHLHGLVPVFLVQLDGIEGTGSDLIHGGVAALGDREVTHSVMKANLFTAQHLPTPKCVRSRDHS